MHDRPRVAKSVALRFEWLNAILPDGTMSEKEVTKVLWQAFQNVTNLIASGVSLDLTRFVQALRGVKLRSETVICTYITLKQRKSDASSDTQ